MVHRPLCLTVGMFALLASVSVPGIWMLKTALAADERVGPACDVGAIIDVDMTALLTFDPDDVAIDVGDVVRWTNSAVLVDHTTSSYFVVEATLVFNWDSPNLDTGEDWEVQFCQEGTWHYFCELHGNPGGMQGDVTAS